MKRIRLETEAYRLGHCFSVTIAAAERARIFISPRPVETCLAALRRAASKYHASVYAYCFMPDHLHLLSSTPPGTDFVQFVRHFKQLSAFRLRAGNDASQPVWQSRFYDHALRVEEDLLEAAEYVFQNPVRAGLLEQSGAYPYSGSFVWPELLSSGSEDPDLHRQAAALH